MQQTTDLPTGAHSELIFGGVNQKHYEGCLNWHDILLSNQGNKPGLWAIEITKINVGETLLRYQSPSVAFVDSGSTDIVGPIDLIGEIAFMNNATCFVSDTLSDLIAVDCTSASGFAYAQVACDQSIIPLKFLVDDISYTLNAEDLIVVYRAANSPDVCLLRIQGLASVDNAPVRSRQMNDVAALTMSRLILTFLSGFSCAHRNGFSVVFSSTSTILCLTLVTFELGWPLPFRKIPLTANRTCI